MVANKTLSVTLIWLLHAFSVDAMPWAVTRYIEESLEVVGSSTLSTKTKVIAPASPVPSALATITKTVLDEYEEYLTVVEILLPPDAQTTELPSPSSSSISTGYYFPITFTPPARCNTTWALATIVDINVPQEVKSLPTPWSVSTSIGAPSFWEGRANAPITTEVYAILYPTDIADDVFAASSLKEGLKSITSCSWRGSQPTSNISYPPEPSRTVTATATGALPTNGVSSFGVTCGRDNPYCLNCVRKDQYCEQSCPTYRHRKTYPLTGTYVHCEDADYWIWGSTRWHPNIRKYILAFLTPWCCLEFLTGILMSQSDFVNLMRGDRARIGIPIPWVVLTLGLGYIFLGPKWEAKLGPEQVDLCRQWEKMETKTKVGLYFRYAFRWTYPPMLGREPSIVSSGLVFRWFIKPNYGQAI